MNDTCDKSLQSGTWDIGPSEVSGGKYEPTHSIYGIRPGEGDTHGDTILEVPECST